MLTDRSVVEIAERKNRNIRAAFARGFSSSRPLHAHSALPIPRRALIGCALCLVATVGFGAIAGAQTQSPATAAAPGSRILDGQSFSGQVGAQGKTKSYNTDSIVFADGYFVSTDCVQYGFTRAPYTAERVGDAIRFRAVTTSPTHGTMTWEGSIRGDEAQAEYRWVRERWFWTQRGEYWFKGQRDGAAR